MWATISKMETVVKESLTTEFSSNSFDFEEGELTHDSLVANYTTTADDFSVVQNESGGRATISILEAIAVVISKMETTTFCKFSAFSLIAF